MLKKHELSYASSCLNKAGPDEPVFVLRAKDPLAAQTVRLWAAMAVDLHPEKVADAVDVSNEMDKWRDENCTAVVSTPPAPMTEKSTLRRR